MLLEVGLQDVRRKPGVPLVERHRQELEAHRRSCTEQGEEVQEGVRVLAPRHPHQDAVSVVDETEIRDGPAHVAEKGLLQFGFVARHRVRAS